jgi:predicted HTH domain antitoxin
MTSISIDIPQEFAALNSANGELQNDIKLCLAALYYQRSLVSIGKAAELAVMPRPKFEIFLSKNKIPVSMLTLSDIHKDLETLQKFS